MKCIVDGCEHFAASRGLCSNHYSVAVYWIKKNTTTWDALEARGLASRVRTKDPSNFSSLLKAAFPAVLKGNDDEVHSE